MRRYIFQVLVAIDQLLNTLTGGYPDETISSRLGKNKHKSRVAAFICAVLDRIDPGHCEESIEEDEG